MEFSLLLKSHSDERSRELLRERYSLSGSQKPFLVLHDGPAAAAKANGAGAAGTPRERRARRRKSTANRQLAQFLASADPNYEIYEPLNNLWNEYMESVLGRLKGTPAAQAVLAADWHGADFAVKAARTPGMVGIRGLVLWESRNQWLVATRAGFKRVPKGGTIAVLRTRRDEEFDVVGDRVQCRTSERTTRKFKPHDIARVAPLLAPLLAPGAPGNRGPSRGPRTG